MRLTSPVSGHDRDQRLGGHGRDQCLKSSYMRLSLLSLDMGAV